MILVGGRPRGGIGFFFFRANLEFSQVEEGPGKGKLMRLINDSLTH